MLATTTSQFEAPASAPHASVSLRVGTWRRIAWPSLAAVLVACAGCAHSAGRRGPLVVYPPPPDTPRYQFLRAYTSEEDVAGSSSFEDFVLGDKEDEERKFRKPYGVAMQGGRIFVTDTVAHKIVVLDLDEGAFEQLRGDMGLGRVKVPINIFLTPDGHKWVADTGREQVLEYGADDEFIRALGSPGQFRPSDVLVTRDRIYVCDVRDHEIEVLDRKTGQRILKFGSPGSDPGQLSFPTNLALGPEGNIFVSDTANFRIQKFGPDGKLLGGFGQVGDVPGTFSRPKGIAVDPEGRIYVVDAAFENIQVFDRDFQLLTILGAPGVEPGMLYLPADVEVVTDPVALAHFEEDVDPRLKPEYLVLVVNQYGPHRVNVFAFGQWTGEPPEAAKKPATDQPVERGVPSLDEGGEDQGGGSEQEDQRPPGDEGGQGDAGSKDDAGSQPPQGDERR